MRFYCLLSSENHLTARYLFSYCTWLTLSPDLRLSMPLTRIYCLRHLFSRWFDQSRNELDGSVWQGGCHVLLSVMVFSVGMSNIVHVLSKWLWFWVGYGGGGEDCVLRVVICAYHFGLSDMIMLIRWDWHTSYIETVLHEAWTVKWKRLQVTRLQNLEMVSFRDFLNFKVSRMMWLNNWTCPYACRYVDNWVWRNFHGSYN